MKMLDLEKLQKLKWLGLALLAICLLGLAFGLGSLSSHQTKGKTTTQKVVRKKPKAKEGAHLTQDYVMAFLTAYFTKKDLGENRNRYLPFMTEAAYTQEVNTEEEPANQAYKGYVVDEKLKSATIYIDSVNHVALCVVNYSQTQLQKKNDYTNAQTDVGSTTTLQLTYTKTDGKYLISHLEPILIVDTLSASEEAALEAGQTPSATQDVADNTNNEEGDTQ